MKLKFWKKDETPQDSSEDATVIEPVILTDYQKAARLEYKYFANMGKSKRLSDMDALRQASLSQAQWSSLSQMATSYQNPRQGASIFQSPFSSFI